MFYVFDQDWSRARRKGGFFIDNDGVITSHEYQLQINRDSDVFITIQFAANKKGKIYPRYIILLL